jgi:cell shape-determining protein MreC
MSRRSLGMLLLLASTGLALGVYHNHRIHRGQPNPITALIRATVAPVQGAIRTLSDSVGGQLRAIFLARRTLRAHDRLLEENARLRLQLSQMEQLQREHATMAALLQCVPRYPANGSAAA